jgi:serine/threonine-protein kinase
MAPEQLRGGLVTRRSDIYAAAIVLWEMLTSDRPFGEPKDTDEMIRLLLSQRPPAPSSRRRDIPAVLDEVVLRGLALDPSGRYATAEEMALDLERAHSAAPAAAVAAWVRAFAGPSLAQRAALVAKAQAATPARRGFPWGRAMLFAGVAAFLVLALLTALRTAR